MAKSIFFLVFLLFFAVTGCSSNDTATENGTEEENGMEEQNGIQDQEWDGPTSGPWSYWDRDYYPNQYFLWTFQESNLSDDRIVYDGWFEITMSSTREGLTRFDYQAYLDTKSEYNDPFEYDGMFVLDIESRENFTHATYDSIAEGQLSEAVHEVVALLDINPLSPYPMGGAYPYLFHDEDFAWEVGTIVAGNGETMKIVGEDMIAGLPGLRIEVDSPQFLGEDVNYEYVINPDLRYPLYLKVTKRNTYVEYILQEYQY